MSIPPTMSEALREAVRQYDGPQRQLALAAGVDPAAVHRFAQGYDIRLATADRLAAALNLELRPRRRRRGDQRKG